MIGRGPVDDGFLHGRSDYARAGHRVLWLNLYFWLDEEDGRIQEHDAVRIQAGVVVDPSIFDGASYYSLAVLWPAL